MSVGEDGEENYDVIDIQIEAQKAVRRITDHLEIVKQYQKVVERAFVTVMGHARAMMSHVGFTIAKRQQLWCEAAQTATLLDSILVQDSAKSPLLLSFLVWMQSMPSI